MSSVTVVSFGDLHNHLYAGRAGYTADGAPVADVTIDLRERMRDPHVDPAFRELTGRDPEVVAKVKSTPGAEEIAWSIVHLAEALAATGPGVTVAIGCAGGRHRSYVMAEWVGRKLRTGSVTVVHRDVHLPVKRRGTETGREEVK